MRTLLITLAAIVVSTAIGQAQGPTQLTLDFGFVDASGNSRVTNINLGEKLSHRFGGWLFKQTAQALYGKTNGKASAESYDVVGRGGYQLTSRIGIFVLGEYQRDPFAGLASRWSGGPGVAVGLMQTPHDTLGLETAITEQRERSVAGVAQSFAAERSAATFKHIFGAKAFLTEALEWVANLKTSDDQRINSETALTAPISRQVALRVSYLIRFDNQPEPGFKKTDRIFTTGVQVAL
jgi:putative salt-induced outer membrane protein